MQAIVHFSVEMMDARRQWMSYACAQRTSLTMETQKQDGSPCQHLKWNPNLNILNKQFQESTSRRVTLNEVLKECAQEKKKPSHTFRKESEDRKGECLPG